MQTFYHGFWAYFFARGHQRVWPFVLGSVGPDIAYIVSLAYYMFKDGHFTWRLVRYAIEAPVPYWAGTVLHSVPLWAVALALSYLFDRRWAVTFLWGWGLHILADALTHNSESTPIFFPIYNQPFAGLISYRDPLFRRAALIATLLMAGYLGVRWIVRRAVRRGSVRAGAGRWRFRHDRRW